MNSLIHGVLEQRGWEPPPVIVYSISVDPGSYLFSTSGGVEGISVVTCTRDGNPFVFNAEISSDPNNIIEELITTGGNSGDTVWVSVIANSTQHEDCVSATITLYCGDEECDLIVFQDGTVFGCS